jgi:hypothetical protein
MARARRRGNVGRFPESGMLDTTTFFSLWYWALILALWAQVCATSYGVPARLLRRAALGGAEDAALADRIARAFAADIAAFWGRWGVMATMGASFALSALVILTLAAESEVALGMLLLAGPVTALSAFALREALLVHRHQPLPAVLLEAAIIRRRIAIATAMGSLALTIAVMALLHPYRLGLSPI